MKTPAPIRELVAGSVALLLAFPVLAADLELYMDTTTKQIFAEPGPGRSGWGSSGRWMRRPVPQLLLRRRLSHRLPRNLQQRRPLLRVLRRLPGGLRARVRARPRRLPASNSESQQRRRTSTRSRSATLIRRAVLSPTASRFAAICRLATRKCLAVTKASISGRIVRSVTRSRWATRTRTS